MGMATLDGHAFRLDPISVSWDFTIKTNVIKTVGGKVVQVLGVDRGDMVVTGSFGIGGWQEQAGFLDRMKALATRVATDPTVPPSRFLYPPQGWDFLVYLKDYSQPQAATPTSVYIGNEIIGPMWQLVFFIAEDNAGLKKAAMDSYIARLSAGLGWQRTIYNGPMGPQDVQHTLNGQSIQDYLAGQFGLPAGGVSAGTRTAESGPGT